MDMDLTTVLIIICIILFALSIGDSIYRHFKKKSIYNELVQLLANGQYDEFFELIDSKQTRSYYPEYNLTYFKLNAYLMKGDNKEAKRIFDDLLSRKLPKKQRTDLVVKAFNFYISEEDARRSKKMLDEINTWDIEKNAALQKDCNRTYNIVIEKKSNYIDEMLKEAESAEGMDKGRLEYFISLQYGYKGNSEKEDEYLKLAFNDSFGNIEKKADSEDSEEPESDAEDTQDAAGPPAE